MTITLRRAVVGVVDTEAGADAVALARGLGATEITLVAVAEPAAAQALLDGIRERAGGDVATVTLHDRVPGRALAAEARERTADVLVLGVPGSSGFHLLHGETGRTALDRAPCPVLVARGDAMVPDPRTIAVGFDGSASSLAAVAVADALARELGAALTVRSIWETPSGAAGAAELVEGSAQWAREQLDALLAELPPRTAGVLVHGRPQQDLRRLSETTDLLVLGTGGHGRARRVLIGSTADALMHSAACPVLVVPPPAADGEDAEAVRTAVEA